MIPENRPLARTKKRLFAGGGAALACIFPEGVYI